MDDFRAASLQSWSTVAPDWGDLTAHVDKQLSPATDWIVHAAAFQSGETVLDLAAGPGTMSSIAARAVGPEGRVICTDFAEPMVEAARRRLKAEGASNVELRVMDAEAIDLPSGSVDAVICRMGFMLMADPGRALKEAGRVLTAGGRLAFAVWADAAANPWAALPMQSVMAHLGAPPPPADAPGMWSLADPDRVRSTLEQAGLDSITIEILDGTVEHESFEQWFEMTRRLAGPLRSLFANLDEGARDAIKQRMADAAKPYKRSDGSLSMPERILAACAHRN